MQSLVSSRFMTQINDSHPRQALDTVSALGVASESRAAVGRELASAVDAGALFTERLATVNPTISPIDFDKHSQVGGTYPGFEVDRVVRGLGGSGNSEAGQSEGEDAEELHFDLW